MPNKEEKQRNELYANLLASSLFLDEEEESKEEPKFSNLSESQTKSHKAVQNFRKLTKDQENQNLLNNPCHPSKPLLKFKKQKKKKLTERYTIDNPSSFLNFSQEPSSLVTENPCMQRKIASQPYKVLDAQNLNDDFYLNLVDWSSTNILAVALQKQLYIWNACTSLTSSLPIQ